MDGKYDSAVFKDLGNGIETKKGLHLQSFLYLYCDYASSAKYLIVLTICDVYEFSLSYHETT